MATSFEVNGKRLALWPDDQKITEWGDPYLLQTTYRDIAEYHEPLIARVNELEAGQRAKTWFGPQACGTKLYDLASWNLDAADFLTLRACELFKRVRNVSDAFVDFSWASAYRRNDFCPPHSHVRAFASVVYMLDPGDADSKDTASGQFWVSDPRISRSCGAQPGCMTQPISPAMVPGTMLIFPGEVVHNVWPYNGDRLRITLSWNINPTPGEVGNKYYADKIQKMKDAGKL